MWYVITLPSLSSGAGRCVVCNNIAFSQFGSGALCGM